MGESLRLRGGGGYDAETEKRCRIAVRCYHVADPSLTSGKVADMLLEQHGEEKTEDWIRYWWNRKSAETKKGQGRPKKLTEREEKTLVNSCVGWKRRRDGSRVRKLSIREAAAKFGREHNGEVISHEFVRKLLYAVWAIIFNQTHSL